MSCGPTPAPITLTVMTVTLVGTQGRGKTRVQRQTFAGLIAAEVRAQMGRLDVTQTQLADALGVSQVAISRRLRGAVPFDVVELSAVADLLGCSVHDLIPAKTDDGPDPVSEVKARRSLPRLDSNQEPSVLTFPQVRRLRAVELQSAAAA